MDDELKEFSTEKLEQVIAHRKQKASKCWEDFLRAEGKRLLIENVFFRSFVLVCIFYGSLTSMVSLAEFTLTGSWQSIFTVRVAVLLLGVCLMYWEFKQVKQNRKVFCVTHPEEAQELKWSV